jgi:cytochrome c oxidase cbb3-type subunit 2
MAARPFLLVLLGGMAAVAVFTASKPPVAAPVVPANAAAPAAEVFTLDRMPLTPAARRGRVVYDNWCAGCHGPEGRGDGPAAELLSPLPRNFQKGKFKFRSTPSGELPTEADLLHVVNCGLPGSAMPGFPLMPEPEKKDVVAWVRHLAEFGLMQKEVAYVMEDEDLTLAQVLDGRLPALLDEVLADAYEEVWPVAVPQDPGSSPALVERGRKLYEAQCVACHGAGGRGDGSSSFHLRDWQDAEILPRDFTTGVFRAGSAPLDLFVRMRTGLNGTPMPAVSGSDEDLWALVHFILSLKDAAAARGAVHPTSCEAHVLQGSAR